MLNKKNFKFFFYVITLRILCFINYFVQKQQTHQEKNNNNTPDLLTNTHDVLFSNQR